MYFAPSISVLNVVSTVTLLILSKLILTAYKRYIQLYFLPGPPLPSFFYGHELQIRQAPTYKYYARWMKEYGHVYRTRGAFSRTILNITDPRAINHILSNPENYHKDVDGKVLRETWFGKGVVTSEGEEHKLARKKLNVAFTPQAVRDVSDVIFDLAERLKTQWEEIIENSGSESTIINITHLMHQTTLDAICRTTFKHDCQANSGESGIPSLLHSIFTLPLLNEKGIIMRYLMGKVPILLELPTQMHLHTKNLKRELTRIAKEVWTNAKEEKNMGGKLHAKLLDALVTYSVTEGVEVNKEQAISFIIEILMAGSETTSNVITECLYKLAWNQDVQIKLRKELVQFEATHGKRPGYEDLMSASTLPYFNAVIKEALRTGAIQNHMSRQAIKSDIIPLKYPVKGCENVRQIKVEAGQRIYILVRDGVNVAEDNWGPDSRVFRPERWLEKGGIPDSVSEIHAQGNVLTFGDGAKVCLGRQFALAEVRILLSTLIRHFTFNHDGTIIDYYFPAGEVIRPYVRGQESGGPKLPLTVGKYDSSSESHHTK